MQEVQLWFFAILLTPAHAGSAHELLGLGVPHEVEESLEARLGLGPQGELVPVGQGELLHLLLQYFTTMIPIMESNLFQSKLIEFNKIKYRAEMALSVRSLWFKIETS